MMTTIFASFDNCLCFVKEPSVTAQMNNDQPPVAVSHSGDDRRLGAASPAKGIFDTRPPTASTPQLRFHELHPAMESFDTQPSTTSTPQFSFPSVGASSLSFGEA
jgi:hypothetical protein